MAFLDNIRQFLARLALGQQLALGAVLVGGVAVLGGVAYWASQPDYALLFGRLEATDASRVVESLRADDIPYQLEEGGTAVYVPRDQVYDLRLRFAGEGVVAEGPVGYELFDGGTLGMTDFMQRLNYKRALEGELARTVSNVRQVAQARVHLVLPERSPFREQQTKPSASVVLQLAGSGSLDRGQVEGIASLVAGAVEGMAVADVTVLDARGTLLSNPDAGNADLTLTSNQLRTQRAVESHLTESGQSMLDRVLGPGRAVVRIAAALDFSRSVQESEDIDPESATVISEERLEENAEFDASNSTVRNYELSRTRRRSEKSIGDVDYLTVSVILDHRPAPAAPEGDEDAAPEPVPYTDREISEVEALVKNAVGFNPERGDRFAIHQAKFDTSIDDQVVAELREHERAERLRLYLRYGLMVLALGLAAWLIRSSVRRVADAAGDPLDLVRTDPVLGRHTAGELAAQAGAPALPGAQTAGALPAHADGDDPDALAEFGDSGDFYTRKLSDRARARLEAREAMYEETKQQAIEQPEETAELIRVWLAQDQEHALAN